MFKDWRRHFIPSEVRPLQEKALNRCAEYLDDGHNVLAEIATGIGKSHIAHSLASCASDKAFIVTSDNQLVRQYERDFSEVPGFESIKGRANFGPCLESEAGTDSDCEYGADILDCWRTVDKKENGRVVVPATCPYSIQKKAAQGADIAFTNIAYYATAMRFDESWEPRGITIFDEAHSLENALLQFLEIVFSKNRFKLLNTAGINVSEETFLNLPSEDDWRKPDRWDPKDGRPVKVEAFIEIAKDIVEEGMEVLEMWMGQKKLSKERKLLTNLIENLREMMSNPDKNIWIADVFQYPRFSQEYSKHGPVRFVMKPIMVRDFTRRLIFRQADQFMFQSATLIDGAQFAHELGIEDWKGVKYRTTFSAENRRVFALNTASLASKGFKEGIGPCTQQLEEILSARCLQKGIVHTGSYELQRYLEKHLKPSPRYLFPKAGESEEYLRRHAESEIPTVLFSPSMTQGVDLKGELARFCVVFKVPYPSLGDRAVKKRAADDWKWYNYTTAKTIIQSLGRGVRSQDDWCDTFIIDSSFTKLYKSYGNLEFYMKDSLEFDPEKGRKAIYNVR